MNTSQESKRKGISPVISTLILLMVTLTVSLTTSYGFINTGYALSGYEKIECLSATPDYNFDSGTWTITMVVKNVGTKTAQISNVYANEVELKFKKDKPTMGNGGADISKDGGSISQGATMSFNIYLRHGGKNQPFSELKGAQTLLIKLVTKEGLEYTKICELCPAPEQGRGAL